MKIYTLFTCLLLTLFCLSSQLSAQVKIGDNANTIHPASVLELEAAAGDKGFLPPRVPLTNANNWSPLAGTAIEGMVVYSESGALANGFYYWDGTQWQCLSAAQDAEWLDANISGTPLILAKQADAAGNTVVITDAGQIGIGADIPSALLDINDGNSNSMEFNINSTSGYKIDFLQDDIGLSIGHNSNIRDIRFKTNATDRMTITSNGNVGIGTTSPTAKLQVTDNVEGSLSFVPAFVSTYTGNTGPLLSIADVSPTNRHVELRLESNGGNWSMINEGDDLGFYHSNRRVVLGRTDFSLNAFGLFNDLDEDLFLVKPTGQLFLDKYTGAGFTTNIPTHVLVVEATTGAVEKTALSSLNDHDWYEEGTTNAPNNIADEIFTEGRVNIRPNPTANAANFALNLGYVNPDLNNGGIFIHRGLNNSGPALQIDARTRSSNDIIFHLQGNSVADDMVFLSNGRTGIGTTSNLVNKLTIDNPSNVSQFFDESFGLQLRNTDATDDNWTGISFSGDPLGAANAAISAKLTDHANNAGQLHFSTKGAATNLSTKMMIDEEGRVGIGTITPFGALHVRNPTVYSSDNALVANSSIVLYGAVGNAVGDHFGGISWSSNSDRKRAGISSVMENVDGDYVGLAFWTQGIDGAGPMSESVRISHSGNVGIGTTNPVANLHINSTAADRSTIYAGARGTGEASIYLDASDGDFIGTDYLGLLQSDDLKGHLWVNTGSGGPNPNSVLALQEQGGKVGIGTTIPDEILEVNGTIEIAGNEDPDDTRMNFAASDKSNRFQIETNLEANTSLDKLGFRSVTSDDILVLTGAGRVGLGINEPDAKLHVTSGGNTADAYTAKFVSSPSSAGSGGIVFTNTEAPTATGFKWHSAGTGTGTFADDDLVLSSIDVATGATNANNIFTIQGNGNIGLGILSSGNPIHHSSGARLTAAGVWTNASDRRLKTNISTTKYGLDAVMQLRPVDYDMKKGGEQQVGFIAQEVQNIIPEVVSGKEGDLEKGETLAVAYGQMVAVLTKAIQEQQTQIEELKKQNGQLVQKNDKLESRVNELDKIKAELSEIKSLLQTTGSNK